MSTLTKQCMKYFYVYIPNQTTWTAVEFVVKQLNDCFCIISRWKWILKLNDERTRISWGKMNKIILYLRVNRNKYYWIVLFFQVT